MHSQQSSRVGGRYQPAAASMYANFSPCTHRNFLPAPQLNHATAAATVPNGGYTRACRLADSHGPLTVSPSDGQDGGAVSAVVIDRSRTVLMERCRLIVRWPDRYRASRPHSEATRCVGRPGNSAGVAIP